MDPFSITLGTISIAQVTVDVVKFLYDVKKGTGSVENDINSMVQEIESIRSASTIIEQSFRKDLARGAERDGEDKSATMELWRNCGRILSDCLSTLKELQTLIDKIKGKDGDSTLDKLQRYKRLHLKKEDLQDIMRKIHRGHALLPPLLTSINILELRRFNATSTGSFAAVSASMRELSHQFDGQVTIARRTTFPNPESPSAEPSTSDLNARSILATTSKSIKKLASLNMHYVTPQPVSSLYKGRQRELDHLKQALADPSTPGSTKRFVVYGLGGSGKTQFCCKFAQSSRNLFWGIFYIDASTPESAKTSYAKIAERANIERNEQSVKYWLSTQKSPWLLIVDDIDGGPHSKPEDYFPEGDSGLVLLTTRNHALKTHGNVGPGFFEFKGLDEVESTDLLLSHADERSPYESTSVKSAKAICSALGFLPQAVVQAGRAIQSGQCTLNTCLDFIRVRLNMVHSRMSDKSLHLPSSEDTFVVGTSELVKDKASEEAIELLKLLSFMDRQRFSFEILIQAVLNPPLEAAQEQKSPPATTGLIPRTWGQVAHDYLVRLIQSVQKLGDKRVLPKVLRRATGRDRGTIETFIRSKLAELRSLALVDYDKVEDSFSMHKLIHWWVRESMPLAEQAAWCQSAATILTQAIMLPSSGAAEGNAELRKLTLAHIEHVQEQQSRIMVLYQQKQSTRMHLWPLLQPSLLTFDLRQLVKFSLIHAEGGQYDEASKLVAIASDFLVENLGFRHSYTIKARLFHSEMLRLGGHEDEAVDMQTHLHAACTLARGENDIESLIVKDKLAVSLWQSSRFLEAESYQQAAFDGFRRLKKAAEVDMYKVMGHLGAVVGKLGRFDEAVKLHEDALNGLWKDQSVVPDDRDVLDVMEGAAMSRYDRHCFGNRQRDDLEVAEALESKVYYQRQKTFNKEHPLTLYASCNYARIKGQLGHLEEADQLFRFGIPIAERVLGEWHLGTLFGKMHHAHNLLLMDRLPEAQILLELVVREHRKKKREGHADQLVAIAFLLECYSKQGRLEDVDELQKKVVEQVRHIFGDNSPWEHHFTKHCK